MTSAFKDGAGDCEGWFLSSSFSGCGSCSVVSPAIFVFYSNFLLFEALSFLFLSDLWYLT